MRQIKNILLRKTILFSVLLFFVLSAHAQQIQLTGIVQDRNDNTALIGANFIVKTQQDSTIAVISTDAEGKFRFSDLNPGTYEIQASYVGFKSYSKTIELGLNPIVYIPITLISEGITLGGVEIVGKTPPVTQKGDTSEIRANSFKVNPDANAEDLVTKMPGMSKVDGKLQAQGEEVKRVLVDGAVFFGNDPSATLKNLPADMIDKVQVFDKASDQAQFTGISDGNEEKTINIITKPDFRTGKFGRVFAGYAPDDKYKVGGVFNSFNNAKRLTIIAQSNNINEQNFANDDMAAMQTSSGGGGRGGRGPGGSGGGPRGGGPPGGGGGGNPFQTSNQGGIVTTHALGINYSDKWAEKVTFQGSVFGNMNETDLQQTTFREYYTDQTYKEIYNAAKNSSSLRMNARITFDIDSFQSIIYSPTFSYGFNNSNYFTDGKLFRTGSLQGSNETLINGDGKNTTINNELMYRKRINRNGRSLSLRLNQAYSSNLPTTNQILKTTTIDTAMLILIDEQWVESNNYNRSYGAEVNYTEPIDKKNSLSLGYNYTIKNNDIDKKTYDVSNDQSPTDGNLVQLLSNVTDNEYYSHRPKLDYRYQDKEFNFSASLGYQYSTLRSRRTYPSYVPVNKNFRNFLPEASIRWNVNKTQNIRLFYRAGTQEPTVNQLQNVVDNTNTLNLTSGNPNLDQSTSHRLFFRYSFINAKSGSNFFIGGGGSTTQDYIGNQVLYSNSDTIIESYGFLPVGAQFSYPVNLDGYYNLRAFASYGLPVYLIKSNVNFNLNTSYTKAPSRINQQINNSQTANYGGGVSIASNFSQNLDFTLSTQLSYSDVKNDINVNSDNTYFNQNTSARINWIFFEHFVLNTDATYYYNQGLSSEENTSYTLWNAGFGYKFLKKNAAEIRLQAFDLLNNNTAIVRNFSDTYYEDVSSNVLNRYFMLMFSYKF